METIAILGSGNVGATLGRRWLEAGCRVMFGTRTTASSAAQALALQTPSRCSIELIPQAVAKAPTILLATPWSAVKRTIELAGDLSGKLIIDCTNPLNERFDGLTLGFTTSAAEQIAEWAIGATVVKAFNTVSVATMEVPEYAGHKATLFYCGDDSTAKADVCRWIERIGMEPIDSGPLQNARYLEPMAMLYIHLAIQQRMGGNCALKMLRRTSV